MSRQESTDEHPEEGDYAQWEAAREYTALLRVPPRFITAPIHFMRIDVQAKQEELSRTSYTCLAPLLRSKSFKAIVYHAARLFFPERITEHAPLDSLRKIAKLFKPDEMIALVTLTYLFRKMKKRL